ncbi:MAG: hypothetical protein RIS34_1812 [Pseudomonadota bacterium]|jgi:hypothetical protein
MKMLRLPYEKVQLGGPLPWNVRDSEGRLLLTRGHIVSSEEQLQALLQRGAFVDIEEIREAAGLSNNPPVSSGRSLNLFGLWENTTHELELLLRDVPKTHDFVNRIDQFAKQIFALVDRDPEVGIYRTVRQDKVQPFHYGYIHSVHTALICILMSRRLGWPESKGMSLVKAALTMNLPILELQGQMAKQEVSLKGVQKAIIRKHPAQAALWLEEAGVTDQDWLTAVSQHHERADGTGYPTGSSAPSELAVALRVADVFMARISPRTIRPALTVQEAARQLFREDKGGPLSMAVIKEFGIYPPGDFVKLKSGELAIVVKRSANAKAPLVAAITDRSGKPVNTSLRRDTAEPEFVIIGTVADKTLIGNMPPERLYGYAEVTPHPT